MQKEHCPNLNNIIKNVLLGLCRINVPYAERLDIYGSLHIRADNCDVANLLLNEHFLNNSRASSPTVTSGRMVDQELAENDADNVQDGQGSQRNAAVKTEAGAGSLEADPNGVDLPSVTETATQPQQGSVPQPSCSTGQSVATWSGKEVTQNSGTVSRYFGETGVIGSIVKGEISDTVAAAHEDQLSDDGVVEILDDDDDDYTDNYAENGDYYNNGTVATPDFKPSLFKTEEDYQTEMQNYGYSNFAQYDNSSVSSPYQYSDMSANSYGQPSVGYSAKRSKVAAYSGGQNTPSSLEKICEYCEESFTSDAQMSAHYLQYHQCPVPQAKSQNRRKTRVHQVPPEPTVHLSNTAEGTVIQMFKCRFCGKMFRSHDGLRNHENVKHSRTKCYQCSFCSMEFLTRQAAYTHRVNFHRLLVKKSQ